MVEKIINDFNKHFNNKFKVLKIYEKNGEAIVIADTDIACDDRMFYYKDEKHIRAITPVAYPQVCDKLLNEKNVIYDNLSK